MALCARLCGKSINPFGQSKILSCSIYRNVSIAPQKATAPAIESYDVKNARLNRPQSPHLTIYKIQLTSMLSITHRFTGLALTAYVAGAGVTSMVTSQPFPEVVQSLHSHPVLLLAVKATIAYPFAYHFVNGIRHLVWDSGRALTIKGVYSTGYIMLGVSGVLTLLLLAL